MSRLLLFCTCLITMLSCSSSEIDNIIPETNPQTKSVTLTIKGHTKTSSETHEFQTNEYKSVTVALSHMIVFFTTEGGDVISKYVANSEPNIENGELEIESLASGFLFQGLPSSVARVYIIANVTDNIKGALLAANSVYEIEALKNKIEDQNILENATLSGANAVEELNEGENVYKVAVELEPLVSRFQIKIKKGKNVSSVKVQGVYVRNFLKQRSFADLYRIDPTDIHCLGTEGGSASNNASLFLDTYYTNMFNYNQAGFNLDDDGYISESDKKGIFGYQFFPPNNKLPLNSNLEVFTASPEIVIRYEVILPGDTTPKVRFTRVKNFKNGANNVEWSVAKLYNMTLVLNQGSDNPIDTTFDAEVTITIADWESLDLTPEYQ